MCFFIYLFSILLDLIFSLFCTFKKSVLYLTYNATAVTRGNGIFGSGVTFAPGVGTIHLDSFGAVEKLFTIFDFGTPKIAF